MVPPSLSKELHAVHPFSHMHVFYLMTLVIFFSLCEIRRGSNIQNIVCVVLDGLGVDHLEVEHSTKPTESNQEKFIEKLNMVEVVSPARYGGNVVQEIALIHG